MTILDKEDYCSRLTWKTYDTIPYVVTAASSDWCNTTADWYDWYGTGSSNAAISDKQIYRVIRDWDTIATTGSSGLKSYVMGNTTTYTYSDDSWIRYYTETPYSPYQPSPSERLKEIIRTRMAPGIIIPGRNEIWTPVRKALQSPQNDRERRARETLCRVIGRQRFRDFMQKGFVTAHNKQSGMTYQIFPGHGITCVYQEGRMIERLCVVLPSGYAPTDSVIVRYLLVLNNEQKLWDMGIKHGAVDRKPKTRELDVRPLTDILQELKIGKTPKKSTEIVGSPARKAG